MKNYENHSSCKACTTKLTASEVRTLTAMMFQHQNFIKAKHCLKYTYKQFKSPDTEWQELCRRASHETSGDFSQWTRVLSCLFPSRELTPWQVEWRAQDHIGSCDKGRIEIQSRWLILHSTSVYWALTRCQAQFSVLGTLKWIKHQNLCCGSQEHSGV